MLRVNEINNIEILSFKHPVQVEFRQLYLEIEGSQDDSYLKDAGFLFNGLSELE